MPLNQSFRASLLLLAVSAAPFTMLGGCASNPVTGRPDLVFQSEAGEIKKSKEVHPMIVQQFGGPYDDQKLQAYVNEVGQRAAKASHRPELEYHFMVLDSEDINAFTTGGGYVYITRGIMNYLNSEAELPPCWARDRPHHRAPSGAPAEQVACSRTSAPRQSASSPAAAISPDSRTTRARLWSAATAATRSSSRSSRRGVPGDVGYSPST